MPSILSRIISACHASRSQTAPSSDTPVAPQPAPVVIEDQSRAIQCLVEADFLCAVCCDLLFKPVVARCGHDFCQECYRRCKTHAQSLCPLCRKPFSRRTPNVCLRLEQTIAALFPLQHQARMKDLLPPPPPPAVSKPSLMSFLLDQFWSSLSLPSSAPVAQVYAAPPPAAPPSEASDDSGDSEVAAEAAAASAAVPDIQPAHIGVLVSSAARLAFATAHETGLVLRQLDNWAIRYRYVVCVATGCLLERYIHFFVQTNGPRNPFGFS